MECSEAERLLFANSLRIYFNNTHKAHRAFKSGFLSEDDWKMFARVFAAEVHSPGGQLWRRGNEATGVKPRARVIDWFLQKKSEAGI